MYSVLFPSLCFYIVIWGESFSSFPAAIQLLSPIQTSYSLAINASLFSDIAKAECQGVLLSRVVV